MGGPSTGTGPQGKGNNNAQLGARSAKGAAKEPLFHCLQAAMGAKSKGYSCRSSRASPPEPEEVGDVDIMLCTIGDLEVYDVGKPKGRWNWMKGPAPPPPVRPQYAWIPAQAEGGGQGLENRF